MAHPNAQSASKRGVKGVFMWNQSKEESENWPVMEGALFIYPHKRAHLYFRPDNFIVLSASTKMIKKKSFPAAHASTRSMSAC